MDYQIPDAFNIQIIVCKKKFKFYAEEKTAAIKAFTTYLGCDVAKRTIFVRFDNQSELSDQIAISKENGFSPLIVILGGTSDTLDCLKTTTEPVFATFATSNFLEDFQNFYFGVLPENIPTSEINVPDYYSRNSLSNSNMVLASQKICELLNLKQSPTINYSINANSTGRYEIDYLRNYKEFIDTFKISTQIFPEGLIEVAETNPDSLHSINYLSDDILELIKSKNISNIYYIDIGLSVYYRDTNSPSLSFSKIPNTNFLYQVFYKGQLVGYTSYFCLVSGGVNPNNPSTIYFDRLKQYFDNSANAIRILYGKQGNIDCFDSFFATFKFDPFI